VYSVCSLTFALLRHRPYIIQVDPSSSRHIILVYISPHIMSNPSKGNERFNAEAAAWDQNPDVHRASALALEAILSSVPSLKSNPKTLDVLEIGCGTGLLSFLIAPHVRSITAVDSAQGMINALNIKLSSQPSVTNIIPVAAELSDPNDPLISIDPVTKIPIPSRRFDLVISHLVLHHIPSLQAILQTMHSCLKAGGSVALTDFEDFGPEARRFHPEAKMEGVMRHGIPRVEMERMMKDTGFVDVRVEKGFEMEKWVEKSPGAGVVKGEGGVKMVFPFLICLGKKGER
jgi:SAM-dependent methyltransferase